MTGQTELDQALEISRKTRTAILFGNNSLEKNLQGFYTVAQILGRKKDMDWAQSELEGYALDYPDCPDYRKNVRRNCLLRDQTQLVELLGTGILDRDCNLSINIIEKILDEKQKYNASHILTKIRF